MVLTDEQVKELKKQLSEQIKNLAPEQKSQAQAQIDSMSAEALEVMLNQQQAQGGESIFRKIVSGEIPTVKVGENADAVAVLDINPISKGHTMIIPRTAVAEPKKIPKSAFKLAEELSKKLIDNLKAKSTKAETDVQFGEAVIHLIPIYDKELDKTSPREKAEQKELEEIKKSLEVVKVDKKPKKVKIGKKPRGRPKVWKLKRRIP